MVARLRSWISGPASAALVLAMVAGCLLLWVGVPLGWLWIGSQVQASASLSAALAVTMLGIVVTIVLIVLALSWLDQRHAALQERRLRPVGRSSPLEVILVWSAGIAVAGFVVWFFGFAGASPLPVNVGF